MTTRRGTAAVMEIARLFAKHPTKRSILLLNFSGEELGLLGSQYFVEHSPVKLDSMQIMMNYDMVGRLRNDKLLVYGVATATELKPLVDSVNATRGQFALSAIGDGYGPSDQSSFYGAGVPVLFFFTDQHEDYHRASDVASKINVVGEARVIDYSAALLRELGDRPSRLTFVKARAADARTRRQRRVVRLRARHGRGGCRGRAPRGRHARLARGQGRRAEGRYHRGIRRRSREGHLRVHRRARPSTNRATSSPWS